MITAVDDLDRADQQSLAGRLIYGYAARVTEVTEYGLSLADAIFGRASVPAGGLRCDVSFEGTVTGPWLRGTVRGSDYGYLRGDGRAELHIHGHVTTDEGKVIALAADGVSNVKPGSTVAQLRENVALTAADPGYEWLNSLQIWAIGTADIATGEIEVKAYAI